MLDDKANFYAHNAAVVNLSRRSNMEFQLHHGIMDIRHTFDVLIGFWDATWISTKSCAVKIQAIKEIKPWIQSRKLPLHHGRQTSNGTVLVQCAMHMKSHGKVQSVLGSNR